MPNTEKCIDVCNRLLRGELSAVETYEQAVRKFPLQPAAPTLRNLLSDHQKSANALRKNIVRMGGTPSEDSGMWGSFTQAIEGTATLLGQGAAIEALREGEEIGKRDYEEALQDEDVLPECRSLIAGELLPRQDQHIRELETLH